MLKNHIFSCSGSGGREFESRHFDQKRTDSPCGYLFFFLLVGVVLPQAHLCAKRRMRVRISRSKIDKLACQAQSADIFSSAENPATKHQMPRVLRRLDFIVIIRRFASLRPFNSLKSSGASCKTVITCFITCLPATSTKK